MIISDLSYLETASVEVVGGWKKFFKADDIVANSKIKQVNYNDTYQKADAYAVSYSKYNKFSNVGNAAASNYNETYQYNEIN